jgi:hypothetical protein
MKIRILKIAVSAVSVLACVLVVVLWERKRWRGKGVRNLFLDATISAIENDRVRLGVERAKVLARALKCHPGILVFPGWELPHVAKSLLYIGSHIC